MKNILAFAAFAGLSAAVAIYFMSQNTRTWHEGDYISNDDVDTYDKTQNTGAPRATEERGSHAMG